jgi:transcriptional regulator with XRE-family HTH domain
LSGLGILNDRIKERRLSLGMTLLEVSEKLEVKEATAQRYESGEIKNIKHETIVALAKILNTTPAYLMGWEDNNIIEIKPVTHPLVAKYEALDERGKHTIDTVLEMEYKRCTNYDTKYEEMRAAHNDNNDKEQLDLMQQDLDEL